MQPVADHIWVPLIAEQLLTILPRSQERPDCIYTETTPQLFYAARLLERLGYVDQTGALIVQLDQRTEHGATTRWDDAYHIFIACLEELQLIQYSPMSRETVVAFAESYGVAEEELELEVDTAGWATIYPSAHTSHAIVHPDILETFNGIGLVASEHWTEASISILWRKWSNHNPTERPADTPLFQGKLEEHFASLPADIADALRHGLSISEELLERKRKLLGGREDEMEVWRLAGQSRMMDLEFLLSERWRFYDGWLSPIDMTECIFFGFDPLASEMAHALLTHKFPDTDVGRALGILSEARPGLH